MKKLGIVLLVVAIAIGVLQARYGAGGPYTDLTTRPLLADGELEVVLEYPEPVGNVAVSEDGRVFFTVHPESRPRGNKLLEWVDGAAEPFPSGAVQTSFDTILGIVIDRRGWLWAIDHGNHGFRDARLVAIDLQSGEIAHEQTLDAGAAPMGSFLQDLQVSADGRFVFIADASIWRQRPALIVYDTATREARRVLERHPSVSAEDYSIQTRDRVMSFAGGLLSLKAGVDGLVLDATNTWLYYGAMNHASLFRVPVAALTDADLPDRQIAAAVERFSAKPLSDGLSIDLTDTVFVTDVEHGAVFAVDQERDLSTVIASPRIRWADGLSFGPGGWLYLADSAIPELVLRSSEHIESQGPYVIFRFRPGEDGLPGQ